MNAAVELDLEALAKDDRNFVLLGFVKEISTSKVGSLRLGFRIKGQKFFHCIEDNIPARIMDSFFTPCRYQALLKRSGEPHAYLLGEGRVNEYPFELSLGEGQGITGAGETYRNERTLREAVKDLNIPPGEMISLVFKYVGK